MLQICDMGWLYFPSKGRHVVDFFTRKIRQLQPGSNLWSWVPETRMLTTRPPKPLGQKVMGLIPDGVSGNFHWHNPTSHTMALGVNLASNRMSTRNKSWSKGGQCVGLTTLPPSCANCLEIWKPWSPGSLWSHNRPVQGLLFLYMCTNFECIVYCFIHIFFSSVIIMFIPRWCWRSAVWTCA
jgi:hypothetical protein